MMHWFRCLLFCACFSGLVLPSDALPNDKEVADEFQELTWYEVGPFRGGRTTTVAGVTSNPYRFYLGATGGGLWRTDNAGGTWRQLGSGVFGSGSVGAVAVSESNPAVLYVGLGESPYRLYTSTYGDGVYRSSDSGESWTHLGLVNTRQIGEVLVHPQDHDVVLVAAQGSPWGPSKDRGVFRSVDGGRSWDHVLFVDSMTGAVDLARDAKAPDVVYASVWHHDYDPWHLGSGGKSSGLFKSSDGGLTWQRAENGLPSGNMGKVGVATASSVRGLLWALVESDARNAGLYKSEDSGNSWAMVNPSGEIRTRPWYYTHVISDPTSSDRIFSLGQDAHVSEDQGKNFVEIPLAGYDFHDLWINPTNSDVMIVGSDGGASITVDGMKSWSTVHNQPTAQLYRVSVDQQVPYRIYSAQQDNTTISISSRPNWGGFDSAHYIEVAGGETGYVEPDPFDPLVIYATNELGMMTRFNRRTNSAVQIHAHLSFREGVEPRHLNYRFAVNSPIVASQHRRCVLYHGAQLVLRTENCGDTWEPISPDLTYDNEQRQTQGGGPYTNEVINHFGAIASIAESPIDPDVIWTGANDGAVAVTRDGGATWHEVDRSSFVAGAANTVEASPHDPNVAYVAFFSMPWNDYGPHIYMTSDGGDSWAEISKGLPPDGPARVIREDSRIPGVLFAGTETGIYFSPDRGHKWHELQLNLPTVAISDIALASDDLVISTQGRGIWILPDIRPLRRVAQSQSFQLAIQAPENVYSIPTNDYRQQDPWADTGFSPRFNPFNFGDTLPTGAVVDYYLPEFAAEETVTITIMNDEGGVVRSLSTDGKEKWNSLAAQTGHNRLIWNLRTDPLPVIPRVWDSRGIMPTVPSGKYSVAVEWRDRSATTTFEVSFDPRFPGDSSALEYRDEMKKRVVNLTRDLIGIGQQFEEAREGLLSNDCESRAVLAEISQWQQANADPRLTINNDRVNFGGSLIYDLTEFLYAIESASAPLTPTYDRRYRELESIWKSQKQNALHLLGSISVNDC